MGALQAKRAARREKSEVRMRSRELGQSWGSDHQGLVRPIFYLRVQEKLLRDFSKGLLELDLCFGKTASDRRSV